MQETLETVFQELVKHKELFGIPASILGVAKTLWGFAEGRSLESRRDKLLGQIDALNTVARVVDDGDLLPAQESNAANTEVKLETARTVRELIRTLERLREKQTETEGLGVAQRAFLLYKPQNWRAWIAHVVCWLSALCIPFYLLGVGISDETDEFSFAVFKAAWSQSDTYGGLLVLLGLFLLARLWGAFERKRRLAFEKRKTLQPEGFAIGTLLAWLYGIGGLALAVGGLIIAANTLRAGLALAMCGFTTALCAVPLSVWAKLRKKRPVKRWWTNTVILLTPSMLLILIVILNLQGVVLSKFRGDVLAYWRSWVHEPIVPLVVLPIAVVPVFASLRALHYRNV